jgi:hypothetical protein
MIARYFTFTYTTLLFLLLYTIINTYNLITF